MRIRGEGLRVVMAVVERMREGVKRPRLAKGRVWCS